MDAKSLLIRGIPGSLMLILILGLLACTPRRTPDSTSAWLPSQVRALDPSESTPNPISIIDPTQDLIALYTRETGRELQIRLDLLELELTQKSGIYLTPPFDLYLELDLTPDDPNHNWDVQILVPANGNPTMYSLDDPTTSSTRPRVIYDPLLDSIETSLDISALPTLEQGFLIQAYITEPGETRLIDQISAVRSTTTVEPVPLLLAFWNTMPAHTPAQALRRWDGAHTGPLGERHGLKHLLDASQEYAIPITLLDLKTPTSLASLDALGQITRITELSDQDLLILPDTLPEAYFGSLPSWAVTKAASTSHQTGVIFDLPGSLFLYTPFLPEAIPSAYPFTFLRQTSRPGDVLAKTQIVRWQDQMVLPLPLDGKNQWQVTSQGLSLSLRRALLNLDLESGDSEGIALLGGDLPLSTWGDPQTARTSLHYLAGHPWINVLDAADLEAMPICEIEDCRLPPLEIISQIDHPVIEALQNAPPGPISDLAWQMFLDLSAPATPAVPELADLRAEYLGEIGNLLAAAAWGSNTLRSVSYVTTRNSETQDCSADTDFDGKLECILFNEDLFALIDPDGGRLAFLFNRTPKGITQLIGPTSQFVVGLSDYREWDLEAGPLADPTNISGAFAGPWTEYQIEFLDDGFRFLTPGVEKSYHLMENGLRVEIHTEQPWNYQIPLAIAPQTRFTTGWVWKYEESKIPQGWIWGIKDGTKVEIRSLVDLSSQNFQESQLLLESPENPNLGYPPGHFLPYPLAIVKISTQRELWVEIIPTEAPQPGR